jgi:hypothetical protein
LRGDPEGDVSTIIMIEKSTLIFRQSYHDPKLYVFSVETSTNLNVFSVETSELSHYKRPREYIYVMLRTIDDTHSFPIPFSISAGPAFVKETHKRIPRLQ